MASNPSNNFRVALAKGEVDFNTDSFKIILMASGFAFDIDTHDLYADVSASELATGFGYTAGGYTLGAGTVTQNDTDNQAEIVWNNPTWVAAAGDIGPVCGAIIYDDTHASDAIVGFIDFSGDVTEPDGGTATIANVKVVI
jgi:hypothetical protein